MSAEPNLRCPVCRALQPLQETCRRCAADLQLVILAHSRVTYLKNQLIQARTREDTKREQQLLTELHWLKPAR